MGAAVPVSAQIPIGYNGLDAALAAHAVPVSAQIPIGYNSCCHPLSD